MKYMLMLFSEPRDGGPAPESAEMQAMMQAWYAYGEALLEAGAKVNDHALQLPDTATVVDVREGKTITRDGPFAETKEVLGGYYIIDVANLDEAIGWAERNPIQQYGAVEIRPVMELPPEFEELNRRAG